MASDQSPALTLSLSPSLAKGNLSPGFLRQQLDQGDVADLVQADEDGVVEHAVGQAALHASARRRWTTWKLVRA